MKVNLLTSVFLSSAVLAVPVSASANFLKPGQYNLVGLQQICLQNTGTWYYTTYTSGGGGWLNVPQPNSVKALIYGRYDANNAGTTTGQDSIEVRPGSNVNWNEWSDDNFSDQILNQGLLTFVKKTCDPKPSILRKNKTLYPGAKLK